MIQTIREWQHQWLSFVVRHHPSLGLEGRAEGFVRLFENYLPNRSKILDIGGGWGFYHEPLKKRGHHLTVLDVVRPGIQHCPVVIYPGKKIPFPDKSFDVSFFVTVLHHVEEIDLVVREALRVTRKRIIVVEDLYHHPLGRMWTILRDQIYNFEFFGHPKNFKKRDEWIQFFKRFDLTLIHDEQVKTKLSGLSILNGVFVFDV